MKKLFLGLLSMAMIAGFQATAGGNAPLNKFVSDYISRDDYIKNASALNVNICEEGMTLLKNKDNILPLQNVQKISIFGKDSGKLQYGGGGSGSGMVNGETQYDIQKSLEEVGYQVNPELVSFYKDNNRSGEFRGSGNSNWSGVSQATIGEPNADKYDATLRASFDEYNDAAVLVFSRGGEEGADCKPVDCRDYNSSPFTTRHQLQLSENEESMVAMVKEKFDKIIVLINSGNIFQCDKFENDDKIQAVIWMGTPGAAGAKAVGRLLKGEVNFSGRTVDTWTRDFSKDPSFQNFSENAQTNVIGNACYPQDTMINPDGTPTNSCTKASWTDAEHYVTNKGLNGVRPACYVSYEEGIYVDYRYYETRYADMEAANPGSGEEWYKSNQGVIYPFGYGLSYTTFNQEITAIDVAEDTILTGAKKKINLTVKVTNTGTVAGKDVVQAYWKAPYISGEIEKAYEVLAGFAKTDILQPGASQELKVSFYIQDQANYDYTDANNNGFKGYELDGGKYSVSINKNAHEVYEERSFQVKPEGIKYENDRYTGNKVENRFSGNDFFSSLPLENDVGFDHMSRRDFEGTFPTHPTVADRTLKQGSRVEEFLTHRFTIADLEIEHNGYVPEAAYKTQQDIPANWSQTPVGDELSKSERMQLSEMIGVDFDDPKWDTFLNEFSYKELQIFVEDGTFHNPRLDAIGKPQSSDSDGPGQFEIIWWAGCPIVAATWNVELAKKQGECIGTEAHITGIYGWLGTAVNIHRSPFGGRNFEYFSADPFLMGRMAGNIVGAATDKGLYCYFKHFVVNDQEKNREGTSTFLSEQTLREIYLKPFQMVIQEGKSTGIMSSYNRLGNMETAASYPLLTQVLREEWGFKGTVMSDMTHKNNSAFDGKAYENINNRVLSGCNAQLDNSTYGDRIDCKWDNSANDGKGAPTITYTNDAGDLCLLESYSWWYAVRKCAKEVLYTYANCGGMDKQLAQLTDGIAFAGAANKKITLNINEAANVNVTVAAELGSVSDLVLDPVTKLPEGLTYANGVISGTPTKVGEYKIHVLLGSGSTMKAQEVTLEVVDPADLDEEVPYVPENNGGNSGDKKKGCKGSIVSMAGLLIAGLSAAYVLAKKKEIEE